MTVMCVLNISVLNLSCREGWRPQVPQVHAETSMGFSTVGQAPPPSTSVPIQKQPQNSSTRDRVSSSETERTEASQGGRPGKGGMGSGQGRTQRA